MEDEQGAETHTYADATQRSSDDLGELFGSLAKAQGAIQNASKSRTNPAFGQKYATLADCRDSCAEPLAANGLCLLQPSKLTNDGVLVTTMIGHASGQWIAMDLLIVLDKFNAHTIGSAITYGRRYGLCAMVGVAPDDDDGNDAVSTRDADARPKQQARKNTETASLSEEDKEKVNRAFASIIEARKSMGFVPRSPAVIMATLCGASFRINSAKTAEVFIIAAKAELANMRDQPREEDEGESP